MASLPGISTHMDRKPFTKPMLPVALLLEGRRCLVVGGGRVALRKATKLVEAGAVVRLVAPAVDARLKALPGITIVERPFAPGDLDHAFLAFATTDAPDVNHRVVELCRERGILCSAADSQWPDGDVILPASFTEDGLTVSVSTSGQSCRRSRLLRESLSRHVRFLSDIDLLMIGIDHSGNAVEALEALKSARPEIESLLPCLWGVHEFMILDTCNRFEAVLLVSASSLGAVSALFRRIAGRETPLRSAVGLEAFQRLAEIASGLRAQAVGETRIVAQLKEALAEAQRQGFAGSGLQGWTDTALHLSKAIRQATEPHLERIETEDLVSQYLASRGCGAKDMLIVGRGEIGQGLARRFPEAVQIGGRSDAELRARLPGTSIVIFATGSPGYLLDTSHEPLLRPDAILIDLSVPRNIDPALNRAVGLNELRAILQPAAMETLASAVNRVVEEHRRDYERLVRF